MEVPLTSTDPEKRNTTKSLQPCLQLYVKLSVGTGELWAKYWCQHANMLIITKEYIYNVVLVINQNISQIKKAEAICTNWLWPTIVFATQE